MKINKIAVVGTGFMGLRLTQLIASTGYFVTLKSRNCETLASALKKIESNLKTDVQNKKLTEEALKQTLAKISGTINFEDLKNSDLIIEAIVENSETKKELFRELSSVCTERAIFASNTSSLSITELANSSKKPDRFIGLHFFNPPAKMKLVEIIKGEKTSDKCVDSAFDFIVSIGKKPIFVNDSPGFLVNRLLFPMINESINTLMGGVACKEDIDASMKLGANHPMGPLELVDLIGLDTCLEVLENLYQTLGDPKFMPSQLLKDMVKKGCLGRKTGRGFYSYAH